MHREHRRTCKGYLLRKLDPGDVPSEYEVASNRTEIHFDFQGYALSLGLVNRTKGYRSTRVFEIGYRDPGGAPSDEIFEALRIELLGLEEWMGSILAEESLFEFVRFGFANAAGYERFLIAFKQVRVTHPLDLTLEDFQFLWAYSAEGKFENYCADKVEFRRMCESSEWIPKTSGSLELRADSYRLRWGVMTEFLPWLIAIEEGFRTALLVTPINAKEDKQQALALCRKVCELRGLQISTYAYLPPNSPLDEKILISKVPLTLPDPDGSQNIDNRFGYPDCCIDAFSGGDISHFLKGMGIFERIPRVLNPFLQDTPFNLFRHLPCSRWCEATRLQGEKLLAAIRLRDKELYRDILEFQSAAAMFTGVIENSSCQVVHLAKAEMVQGILRYDVAFTVNTWNCSSFEVLRSALLDGDGVRIREVGVEVYRGTSLVHTVKRPLDQNWTLCEFYGPGTSAQSASI